MKWLKRIRNQAFTRSLIFVGLMVVTLVAILFLIPAQVCQGEDTIHTPNHPKAIPIRDLNPSQVESGPKETPKYEYAFSYGLFVHHYTSEKANEGFENRMMAFERKGLIFSYFDNSYNEDTVFLGYGWHSNKHFAQHSKWWTRGNLYLGGLVGYGDKNPLNCHGVGLGVYPTASIGYERYSVEMGVMPTFVWWALKVEF